MLSCTTRPSSGQSITHAAEPTKLYNVNLLNGMRMVPSNADGTVDRPGTNFAISSTDVLRYSNYVRACRIQESGNSNMRYSNVMTYLSQHLPVKYHRSSPSSTPGVTAGASSTK